MKLENIFSVSLCKNGILGGWIIVEDSSMTYKTGKVTIPEKYRNLEMKYEDVVSMTEGSFIFIPTITVEMKNKEAYKFLVFNKNRFLEMVDAKRNNK